MIQLSIVMMLLWFFSTLFILLFPLFNKVCLNSERKISLWNELLFSITNVATAVLYTGCITAEKQRPQSLLCFCTLRSVKLCAFCKGYMKPDKQNSQARLLGFKLLESQWFIISISISLGQWRIAVAATLLPGSLQVSGGAENAGGISCSQCHVQGDCKGDVTIFWGFQHLLRYCKETCQRLRKAHPVFTKTGSSILRPVGYVC